jgi:O-antigen/teichoic acid export membrane protein
MTSLPLKPPSGALHLSARAAVVTGVYLAAAVAVLLTVIVLRPLVPPATLDRFLGFILIASLAAGLEPGTVKAAALREAGGEGASTAAYLAAGAIKALAASPVLALVWRFADPSASATTLAWTPALAVAGFCATDLRARLDLRGRYAMALVVKQASLAGGFVLAGSLIAMGAPLSGAVGVSCVARLSALVLAAKQADRTEVGERIDRVTIGSQIARLLADRRWMDLAAVSVIAAAGGGADRLFGLRYLSPAVYGSYFLTCELLSRFWLIPYILSPILFARRAAGTADDGFARAAWSLVALAGAVYLAATAGLSVLAPRLLRHLAGADFGLATLAFAAAVVVNSFSQLRLAELQAAGRSRRAALATAVGAAVSIPLFFVAVRAFGAGGLLLAWLAKSLLELAALTVGRPAAARMRGDGAHKPG